MARKKKNNKRKTNNNPQYSTVEVTPKKAEEWLQLNTQNRRVRARTVDFYAEQMRAGKWGLTGQPIIFSKKGELIDGQHRLHAVVQSGCTVKFTVAKNVENENFTKIDTGINRSAGDILHIAGYNFSSRMAAAVRVILVLETIDAGQVLGDRFTWSQKIDNDTVLSFVNENADELHEACIMVDREEGKTLCRPKSVFSALYFLLHRVNGKRCKEFFHMLVTGEGCVGDNPVRRLRSALMAELSNKGRSNAIRKQWMCAVTIKAWNHWLKGESVKHLRWHSNEKWPAITRRKEG